jgi:predicted porin
MKISTATLTATLLASASMLALGASAAKADDYTDLLQVLRARGSLSSAEYSSLLRKHQHGARVHHMPGEAPGVAPVEEQSAEEAKQNALAAAASAAAANAAMEKMTAMQQQMETMPDLVHVEPYKPGAGVTVRVGQVDLNFSGIVNGFYTFSSADHKPYTIGGGLTDNSGFDSSSVRNGLLPGAFIFTASTTQEGIDVSATFGVYPGINSTSEGALGANTAGNATALGTANGDFRKMFMTFGTKELGTIKIGRDIGIFGSDAILNDQTLLGVGATGGNADPGNTSLGRIGYGYIYADFLPQITYISPILAGFQLTVGAFQPMNEFDFSGFSGTASAHNTPEFEGKVTYDYKISEFTAHVWVGGMTQDQQDIVTADDITLPGGKETYAGEGGAALTYGPLGLTAYIYRGRGVGTTAKFFDGVAPNGELRDSEGGYIQGSIKILPKLKLVASYGQSSLFQAPGENSPLLVERNEAEVAGAYYNLTDWVTLVGEYAHEDSRAQGGDSTQANAFTAGAILFY